MWLKSSTDGTNAKSGWISGIGARKELRDRPEVEEVALVFAVFLDDVDLSEVEEEFEDSEGVGAGLCCIPMFEWLLAFRNENMLISEFLCGFPTECEVGGGDGGGVGKEFESTTVDSGDRLMLERLPEDALAFFIPIDGFEVAGEVSAVVISPLVLLMESIDEDEEDGTLSSPTMNFGFNSVESDTEGPFPPLLFSFAYGDLVFSSLSFSGDCRFGFAEMMLSRFPTKDIGREDSFVKTDLSFTALCSASTTTMPVSTTPTTEAPFSFFP